MEELQMLLVAADPMFVMPFREVNVIAVTHANLLTIQTEQVTAVERDGVAETEEVTSQLVVPLLRVNVIAAVVADSVTALEETMLMPVSHPDAMVVVVATETPKCAELTKTANVPEAVAADSVTDLHVVMAASLPDLPAEPTLYATSSKRATATEVINADSVTQLMFARTAVETTMVVNASVVCAMISKRVTALEVMDAASLTRIK
jgi:hypothetical protein